MRLLTLLLIICAIQTHAQVQFEANALFSEHYDYRSGTSIGAADFNKDGLLDLVVFDKTKDLIVMPGDRGNSFQTQIKLNTTHAVWSMVIADFDGNGYEDMAVISEADEVRMYFCQDSLFTFVEENLTDIDFLPQSSSAMDLNNDGLLDLFVCNDFGYNLVLVQDESGKFRADSSLIDFHWTEINQLQGNYSINWTDYNRDGRIEGYLSKCRGAADSTEPARINQFFFWNDSVYVDRAPEMGLNSSQQSWVTMFADVDNDLDFDMIMSHHNYGTQLWIQNSDGTFVDETELRGLDVDLDIIQNLVADFDNDGDVDLLFVGTEVSLMLNENGKFSETKTRLNGNVIGSAIAGDMNNDGAIDLYATYMTPYNAPSNRSDVLWYNTGNDNHYISFNLKGTHTNASAVHSIIELYADGKKQIRSIEAGNGYGIQNSKYAHFGLGSTTKVDSLKIYWYGQNTQTVYNLEADRIYEIKEDDYIYTRLPYSSYTDVICPNDSVRIAFDQTGNFIWDDGSTDSIRTIYDPGYYAYSHDTLGQYFTQAQYYVPAYAPRPQFIINPAAPLYCDGQITSIAHPDYPEYVFEWNNGTTGENLIIAESGNYAYIAEHKCGIEYSDTVTLQFIKVNNPITTNDTVKLGKDGLLTGAEPYYWYNDANMSNLIGITDSLVIINPRVDQQYYAYNVKERVYYYNTGLEKPNSTGGYHSNALNLGMNFDVYDWINLYSFDVYTDRTGPRNFQIQDLAADTIFYQYRVELDSGLNTIEMDISLPSGTYYMTTETQLNLANLGYNSPRLMRQANLPNDRIKSSYMDIELTTSTNNYYYFFNIEYYPILSSCFSNLGEAWIVIDSISSTIPIQSEKQVKVWPLVTADQVYLDGPTIEDIALYASDGTCLRNQGFEHSGQINKMEMAEFKDGLYYLLIKTAHGWESHKLIKQGTQ